MSSNYYSIDTIASALGLDKSIVSQVLQNLVPDCKFPYSSHPSKLSDYTQFSVARQTTTRRATNAAQVQKYIKTIISDTVPS